MTKEFEDIFNTTRLTIQFGTTKIGADIEPGVELIDALKEVVSNLERN